MDTNSNQARRVVIGITAHVDAGKTTLAEAMLYRTGRLRKLGRVDHGSAAMDSHLLDVNPFDQPGVEAYKKNMFALLGKPGYEDMGQALREKLGR